MNEAAFIDELEKISKDQNEKFAGMVRLPISSIDQAAWNRRKSQANLGPGDGCSLVRTEKGFCCYTHRTRSSFYPTVNAIPLERIRFVASTA